MSASRFIYLTGCDGAGKTSHSKRLAEQLRRSGTNSKMVRVRFPFLLSLPLLAYARVRGYSWQETINEVTHGYWEFRRSRLLRKVLPWTLLLDAAAAGLAAIHLPLLLGATIVCERFSLDMLVDLAVAFDDPDLLTGTPGRWFPRLLPRRGKVVVLLQLDAESSRRRRPDLRSDRGLENRISMYQELQRRYGLESVSNQGSFERVAGRIQALIGQ